MTKDEVIQHLRAELTEWPTEPCLYVSKVLPYGWRFKLQRNRIVFMYENHLSTIITKERWKMKTREEVLASIKEWPVDIDDANAPDGWSWSNKGVIPMLICNTYPDQTITRTEWSNYVWAGAKYPISPIKAHDPATVEQPEPCGKGDPILGMVLADLTNRALEGTKKYGEPLKAHNGRNALWDAYQEALDLAMYLRQAIEEQKQ